MPPESQSQPILVDVVELDDPRLACFEEILVRRNLPKPLRVQGLGVFDHESGWVKPAVQVIVDCERDSVVHALKHTGLSVFSNAGPIPGARFMRDLKVGQQFRVRQTPASQHSIWRPPEGVLTALRVDHHGVSTEQGFFGSHVECILVEE